MSVIVKYVRMLKMQEKPQRNGANLDFSKRRIKINL